MNEPSINADPTANSKAGSHKSKLGPFEIWYGDEGDFDFESMFGWYWWPCWPGCLPDAEANGPFKTSDEAYEDVMRGEPL